MRDRAGTCLEAILEMRSGQRNVHRKGDTPRTQKSAGGFGREVFAMVGRLQRRILERKLMPLLPSISMLVLEVLMCGGFAFSMSSPSLVISLVSKRHA